MRIVLTADRAREFLRRRTDPALQGVAVDEGLLHWSLQPWEAVAARVRFGLRIRAVVVRQILRHYVSVANVIGAEDAEGRRILPVLVTLVRDAKFDRFQKAAMSVSGNDDMVPIETDAPEPRFVTATFIGRIDAVSNEVHDYLKTPPLDKRSGLGFGQMGSFEAQFTLQSVEDDPVLQ